MRPNRIAVYCQVGDDWSKITRPGNAVEPDFQKVRQRIFAPVTGGAWARCRSCRKKYSPPSPAIRLAPECGRRSICRRPSSRRRTEEQSRSPSISETSIRIRRKRTGPGTSLACAVGNLLNWACDIRRSGIPFLPFLSLIGFLVPRSNLLPDRRPFRQVNCAPPGFAR